MIVGKVSLGSNDDSEAEDDLGGDAGIDSDRGHIIPMFGLPLFHKDSVVEAVIMGVDRFIDVSD